MRIKNLLMYVAAGAFALTSCNNDNKGGMEPLEEEISFYLKVTREEISRADASQVADGTKVVLDNGALLFASATGDIVRVERITSSFATGTVSPDELEAGHLFSGIDASAEKVYIIANVDFNGLQGKPNNSPLAFSNISQFDQTPFILSLADQTDTNYGITEASLYGEAPLVPATSPNAVGAGANREAQLKLTPLIARVEILKVSADSSISDDNLAGEEWNLEGIYIDDFYYKSTVRGAYSQFEDVVYNDAATATGIGNDIASYLRYSRYNDGAPYYGVYTDTEWYPILFDDGDSDGSNGINGLGTGVANTISPKTTPNGAWAYNFYPDATNRIHIILHLTNVHVSDGLGGYVPYNNTKTGTPGEAYLTVTNYKVRGSNPNSILNLEAGYIYRITDLAFTDNDLREEPEQPEPGNEKLDVWVEVELMEWTVVDTDPIFN